MAGPTPVSALIHAATMVTSGVVLLNRMNIVFQLSPVASAIVCVIGAFTAIFAAVIAFGQTDIKKVLAYSTVSQLGYMFIGCGAGAYWTGMFHVTTHAFFKALLFLGAGAVIHAMAHDQDMRNYGNLRKYLPITTATMVIGWLAISGVPLLSGAVSKEAILGAALAGHHADVAGLQISQLAGWVGLVTAALTAIYMTRMTFLTFFGKEERWRNGPVHADVQHKEEGHEEEGEDSHNHGLTPDHKPHEVPASMAFPLVVLAILSVIGGFWLEQGGRFEKWLYPNGLSELGEVPVHYPNLMALAIGAAALGLVVGFMTYRSGLPKSEGWDETKWSPWRKSAQDQFGYDRALTLGAVTGGADVATVVWQWFDNRVVDGAVNGAGALAQILGRAFRGLQTGAVRLYAMMMLVGGVAFLGYFLWVMNQGGMR